jgi:hypothetical protein
MKTQTNILIIAFLFSVSINAQKAIFLHHSTGDGVFSEGQVTDKIVQYNSAHQTNYQIDEFSYPDSPYPWANYPYDFWNLWINGGCNSDKPGIECLETLSERYDVIVFKHCFPGANIQGDAENPDVSSGEKTLANYKLQYRALREKFDQFPDRKFVVWTLTPQHRNATNPNEAARAREFVNWVKNSWLSEDGNHHSNIFIFDFFNVVAESNEAPANGAVNCLKYEYEGDHDGSDGHPNQQANQAAGEEFVNFMVQVFQSSHATENLPLNEDKPELVYKSNSDLLVINGGFNEQMFLSIVDMSGRVCTKKNIHCSSSQMDLSYLPAGVYMVNISSVSGKTTRIKIAKFK